MSRAMTSKQPLSAQVTKEITFRAQLHEDSQHEGFYQLSISAIYGGEVAEQLHIVTTGRKIDLPHMARSMEAQIGLSLVQKLIGDRLREICSKVPEND